MDSTEKHSELQENVLNENDVDSTSFTIEVKSQVEQLIKAAKRQCDKEKHLLQEKYHKDIANLKSQMILELNKAFENDLLNPLKAKLNENENEIRTLRGELLASKEKEEKLEKDKNVLQNSINILKLRVEKLEGHLGKNCYSKPEMPIPEDQESHRKRQDLVQETKNIDYDKTKKASPVITESKGAVAGGHKSGDLLDTDTVILHLEFTDSQTDTNPIVLYDRRNHVSEIKTVDQVRAISQAFNNHFNPPNQKTENVEKHLEMIDRKLEELQQNFVQSTAETHATLVINEIKYNQNSMKLMEEITNVQRKIDDLVRSIEN